MQHQGLLAEFALCGIDTLGKCDPALYTLLEQEYRRQNNTLALIAAASIADPSTLICEGMTLSNITTEGYPGTRFHAGCAFVDEVERLAIERAKGAFKAKYVNVQPHSGTSANEIVMFSVLDPGDTILGLEQTAGGHLTHGSKASISGRYFRAIGYGLTDEGFIDYEQVRRLAQEYRPRLIICGASAYPRVIDFCHFRRIADEVNAFLLADISHISGLVVAGKHPSPVDAAHFVTTSTYKQLYGPRGGLIIMGKDAETFAPDGKRTLAALLQRGVFPFFQGTPNLGAIAAKARALALVMTAEFGAVADRIVSNARCLADCLMERGYKVLTGGTDNHLLLIDVTPRGMTGVIAERALETCDIIVNKNRIPGEKKAPQVTSGIRLGTNCVALRGMGTQEMQRCAFLIDQVLSSLVAHGEYQYTLDHAIQASVQAEVHALCDAFPLPHYPRNPTDTRQSIDAANTP